jgi:hypothetical protein
MFECPDIRPIEIKTEIHDLRFSFVAAEKQVDVLSVFTRIHRGSAIIKHPEWSKVYLAELLHPAAADEQCVIIVMVPYQQAGFLKAETMTGVMQFASWVKPVHQSGSK